MQENFSEKLENIDPEEAPRISHLLQQVGKKLEKSPDKEALKELESAKKYVIEQGTKESLAQLSGTLDILDKSIEHAEMSPEQYFELSESDIKVIKDLEKELNFDVTAVLKQYQQYIDEKLLQNEKSTLDPKKLDKLVSNVKKLIRLQIGEIAKIADELREENGSLENMQWILNQKLVERFDEINNSVLASAKFYINMHNPDFAKGLEERFYSKKMLSNYELVPGAKIAQLSPGEVVDTTYADRALKYKSFVMSKLDNIEDELVDGNIEDADTPSGILGSHSYFERFGNPMVGYVNDEVLAANVNGKSINKDVSKLSEKLSFLNEEDKKIENEAMMYFLAAVAFQMLPYAGAVASVPVDIEDVFGSKEATMENLKRLGLVDKRYNMEKTWVDNAFGAVGLVATLAGLQGAVKSGKFAKTLNKVKGLSPSKFVKALETLGSELKVDTKAVSKLTEMVFGGAKKVEKVSEVEEAVKSRKTLKSTANAMLEVERRFPNPEKIKKTELIKLATNEPEIFEALFNKMGKLPLDGKDLENVLTIWRKTGYKPKLDLRVAVLDKYKFFERLANPKTISLMTDRLVERMLNNSLIKGLKEMDLTKMTKDFKARVRAKLLESRRNAGMMSLLVLPADQLKTSVSTMGLGSDFAWWLFADLYGKFLLPYGLIGGEVVHFGKKIPGVKWLTKKIPVVRSLDTKKKISVVRSLDTKLLTWPSAAVEALADVALKNIKSSENWKLGLSKPSTYRAIFDVAFTVAMLEILPFPKLLPGSMEDIKNWTVEQWEHFWESADEWMDSMSDYVEEAATLNPAAKVDDLYSNMNAPEDVSENGEVTIKIWTYINRINALLKERERLDKDIADLKNKTKAFGKKEKELYQNLKTRAELAKKASLQNIDEDMTELEKAKALMRKKEHKSLSEDEKAKLETLAKASVETEALRAKLKTSENKFKEYSVQLVRNILALRPLLKDEKNEEAFDIAMKNSDDLHESLNETLIFGLSANWPSLGIYLDREEMRKKLESVKNK